MITQMKMGALLMLVFSLTACFDNKSSDKKTVAALNAQNKILQEQLDQTLQNKPSVSLTGIIKNQSTNSPASNATVKVKTAGVFSQPVAVTNGTFQIDNVSPGSDFELVVQSTTGAFMDRVLFGKASAATSGKVIQDLGTVNVAVGVEHSYKLLDEKQSPIASLTLKASSAIGDSPSADQYHHAAVYDAATQQYKITIPDALGVTLFADLDLNHDGKKEYSPIDATYNSAGNLTIAGNAVFNTNVIYLDDLNSFEKIKIKLSMLDTGGLNILNQKPVINDALNGNLVATYSDTTQQYVVDALLDSSINVYIPPVTIGGMSYKANFVQIIKRSEFNYDIVTDSQLYPYSLIEGQEKIFNVAVSLTPIIQPQPAVAIPASLVPENKGIQVFYTMPIKLKDDSVTLTQSTIRVC